MLVIAEVVGEFGLHDAFEDRFSKLLEQPYFAEHVFRGLIVLRELINQV